MVKKIIKKKIPSFIIDEKESNGPITNED